MKIHTILTLALSVVITDCMLLTTQVQATEVENIQATPQLESVQKETKKSRKIRKNDIAEAKSVGKYIPALPDESTKFANTGQRIHLQGGATYVEVSPKFGEAVHMLTKSALDLDPKYKKAEVAVDKYRTKLQRSVRFTKDAINYTYPYRGFSMSMEGSRLLLDKEQKLNNLCIAEFSKQRFWDEMHPRIMAKLMQIAMGLGMEKSDQADIIIQNGVTGLTELVGKEAAESTLAELTEWNSQLSIPEQVFQQSTWDVDMTERIYQNARKISADGDPLVHSIYKSVKKYDHGKLANFTASAVEANLAAITVLSGSPLISITAEGASTAFVMTTGGPEENKILKELYFGRRLEIRRKRIAEETQLALTNYEKALHTHNCTQLALSEIVLAQLVGPEKVATVLERESVNDFIVTAPIELAQEEAK